MKHHMIQHHLSKSLAMNTYNNECKICGKKYYEKKKVAHHMKVSHENGYDCGSRVNSETNYYDCYTCGASYSSLNLYRSHDCDKGRYQIKCNDCQMPMRNAEKLKAHKDFCRSKKQFGY
jgi:hypothetical protein